mgnify:FL=1
MKTQTLIQSALATAIALGASFGSLAQAADAPAAEKCYGVVKAGKNDCQTNTHACAGQAKADYQGDSWVYLPKGTCEKITGGSLTKKA